MNDEIPLLKKSLRERLRARLREKPASQREAESARACALLMQQPVWRQAQAVLFYSPLADEVDLRPLLEQALAAGKIVALPRFVPASGVYVACRIESYAEECQPGRFGIHEPPTSTPIFPLNRLDLTLVPGVGFSTTGHRLGRGRGYYDRILAEMTALKCGVAFDEQVIEHIPAESHDMVLNFILTPTRWVEIRGPLSPP